MQYYLLKEKIAQIKPSAITVDVFDTLLLRKWQPEQWRFYLLAGHASKILNKSGFRTTTMFIFEQRNYFSEILRQANLECGFDYETKYEDIFSAIIGDLCKRQNIKITKKTKTALLQKLKRDELEFESKQLYLNKRLYKTINKKKTNVYFVSDMYLGSKDIAWLLKHSGANAVKNGISSADFLVGKHSARSFIGLANKNPNITLNSTLHIGDNRVGDKKNPILVGVSTFWLVMPFHSFKLATGRLFFNSALKLKRVLYIRRQRSLFLRSSNLIELTSESSTKTKAKQLGWLFAPAIVKYLHFLGNYSTAANAQVAFITSESKILNKLYMQLGFDGAQELTRLSRNKMIQAYSSVLYKKGIKFNSILSIAKKILRRKTNSSALATLQISPIESKRWNIIGPSRTKLELGSLDLRAASSNWQKEQKKILSTWNALQNKSNKNVIFADVGWNDTIQILLSEILKENDFDSSRLSGKYLGRTGTNIFSSTIKTTAEGIVFNTLRSKQGKYLYQPEVWESFLNNDNTSSPTRKDILDGINEAIDYFVKSQLSADSYYNISKALLYKTLRKPNKKTIETLASLEFDYGTLDEDVCPLVNVSRSKIKVYYWLLFNRAKFKDFYFHQGWKWGSANYYSYKLAYRLWRFKTKKPSF